VYFTWRNLRATQAKLDIDREGQITNRFTQAVAQLGSELMDGNPNLEVRLGGIYALERIARDSPRDHWTITEVLTVYVRRNAPWPPTTVSHAEDAARTPSDRQAGDGAAADAHRVALPKPRTDIQAVLTVLGRRMPPQEHTELGHLDLSYSDLRNTVLAGAHLARAVLRGARLD
jgi:hypothetical protein